MGTEVPESHVVEHNILSDGVSVDVHLHVGASLELLGGLLGLDWVWQEEGFEQFQVVQLLDRD